jgi:hypothetical protein
MRPVGIVGIVFFTAILFTVGCTSNNKGKIEATKWKSLPGTVKGLSLPAGAFELQFGGNGQMIYTFGASELGPKQTFRGTYDLGIGDIVTLNLDTPLAGSKVHAETVIIEGDRLTMTDTDGTSLTFAKAR